jgi:hypothetical protein
MSRNMAPFFKRPALAFTGMADIGWRETTVIYFDTVSWKQLREGSCGMIFGLN